MLIYSIIAFSALIVAIISTILAITGRTRNYWFAAIGMYIFSFLAGFSIGQVTVGLTFVLLALAIGFTFKLLSKKAHIITCLGIGILVGVSMVAFVDDYWIFYPLWYLS